MVLCIICPAPIFHMAWFDMNQKNKRKIYDVSSVYNTLQRIFLSYLSYKLTQIKFVINDVIYEVYMIITIMFSCNQTYIMVFSSRFMCVCVVKGRNMIKKITSIKHSTMTIEKNNVQFFYIVGFIWDAMTFLFVCHLFPDF